VGLLAVLGLAAATCLAYGRSLHNDFVDFDDPEYVTGNDHILSGLTRVNVVWAFTAYHANNWHPLTWLSLQLDAQLFGARAWGYHLTNLLLHVVATLLLFGVLRRMTGAVWRSALVAALFAVHPLHVESVAWVSERKDVLSAVFWMLTMWAYAWYADRPSLVRYLGVVVIFALGLMAKPMLVTLPCVLLLLDYWPLRRTRWLPGPTAVPVWRLVAEKVPLLALAGGASLLTVGAQHHIVRSMEEMPLGDRLQNVVVTYGTYLGQMFWPAGLTCFYPHRGGQLPLWVPVAAAVLLVGVSLVAVAQARLRPYLPVGWFWYLGTLVPVVGLVQVGMHAHADRYTYLPLVGVFIVLVWSAAELAARWRLSPAVLAAGTLAVLGVCVVRTWEQVGYWKDSVTLWQHAVDVTDDAMAHFGLGTAQAREPGLRESAAAHLARALQLRPGFKEAADGLALVRVHQGRQDEAVRVYAGALQRNPEWAEGHLQLGTTLLQTGDLEHAAYHLAEAVRLQPDLLRARYGLVLAYAWLGRSADATQHYRQAKERDPEWPSAFRRLAWLLATDPNDARRDGGLALALMRQVEEATADRSPDVLDALAAAHAAAGHYDQAVRTMHEAITAAEAQAPERLPALRARLRLYKDHQPYRAGATRPEIEP
jgi:Flp pilus assembly protein TadD